MDIETYLPQGKFYIEDMVAKLEIKTGENSYRQIGVFLTVKKIDCKKYNSEKYDIVAEMYGLVKEDIIDLEIGDFINEVLDCFNFAIKYFEIGDKTYQYIR